ncbi:hypothetical protein [Endozoicomonas sp. SESOKO1]|uniref:hypothetical protein n=1 Tax=Endozoicomonas sp. SESOKO1 TaxID=2828742 RepID=UPI002148471E|nr:hypothetical protein [Endozoicomonas sp. SESOKO1]
MPSFAYRFEEKTVSTRLNIEQLNALGVPRGELWGLLQKGQTITLGDGREILPEQVLQPPPASRIAIIAGDFSTWEVDRAGRLIESQSLMGS